MKNSNELNEQELDDISGGPHYTDFNGRPTFMCRGIIVPDSKVGVVNSNPTPHPGKRFSGRYGVINPDSM